MSTKEMPFNVKFVVILRDSLEKMATELTELLKERMNQEFGEEPITESVEEPTEKTESTIPDFDSEDLMKHDWKGKKIGEGEYAKGSLNWGWDFRDNFKPETIKALEDGKILTIGKNDFILLEKIVQTKQSKGA